MERYCSVALHVGKCVCFVRFLNKSNNPRESDLSSFAKLLIVGVFCWQRSAGLYCKSCVVSVMSN